MERLIKTALVALTVAAVPLAANAEPNAPDESAWIGTWSTNDGANATISITANGGLLDILGKDAASTFMVTCILSDEDLRRAECVGHGTHHGTRARFLYKSTLKINGKGQIVETWQADAWDPTVTKRDSKHDEAVFIRPTPPGPIFHPTAGVRFAGTAFAR